MAAKNTTIDGDLLLGAFQHTYQPVVILNDRRQIVSANRSYCKLFGYEPIELLGHNPAILLLSPLLDEGQIAVHQNEPWGQEYLQRIVKAQTKGGRNLWIRVTSSPIADDVSERFQGYSIDVVEDITDERNVRDLKRDVLQALTSNLSFLDQGDFLCRRVSEIAPDIIPSIMYIDKDNRLRPWAVSMLPRDYVNGIDGLVVGEGVGSCGTAAARGVPVVSPDIETDPLWRDYVPLTRPHGLKSCWSYPIKRRDGTVAGSFAFYSKMPCRPNFLHTRIIDACMYLCMLAIDREEDRERTERLKQFDQLTGLPNSERFRLNIDRLIARTGISQLALISFGLDRLREINEGLGPAAGDQVILEVAARLQADLGPNELLGRTEGDQFAIVTPECNAHAAVHRVERLQAAITAPIESNGHQLKVSASFGIVLTAPPYHTGLLVQAQKAMYEAKAHNRGGYRFFETQMNQQAQRRLLMGTALRRALAHDKLRLHYQPQVETANGRLYGVEALARWHDPVLGAVSPRQFIGLAEDLGEIGMLGRWALREACQQLAAWRDLGLHIPTISVNLSPTSFDDCSLVEYIANLLQERALSPGSLTVEITESAVMTLTRERLKVVHDLRRLGIGLSVDDFGTGYASLSNLANLPVTEVKIDRSFVKKCADEPRMRSLVMAIIGIGKSLQLSVVVEGVEHRPQYDLLTQFPHVVAQGYLLAGALPAPELARWVSIEPPLLDVIRNADFHKPS